MVLSMLQELMTCVARAGHKENVIQDLEFAMRAKGGLSPEDDMRLRAICFLPQAGFMVASGLGSYMAWFCTGIGNKFTQIPLNGLQRFGISAGVAYFAAKVMYRSSIYACAAVILRSQDERLKMELANIILTKHSDDEALVQTVKRHFFAEHLFDDLHQDKPLFRWHPRHSYVDSAFVERVKEIESSNSPDEATSASTQTTLNRGFGDLAEDPFACILGSSGGSMESNISPEKSVTVLKRSELRARRRSHRHHHHRHADKLAAS